MAASLVATHSINPDAEQVLSENKARKPNLRQRIEKLLREMFGGHAEPLGWTPD